MESSRANSGQSAPLLSQEGQPSTAVGFQQQGTVDWTSVLSGSVTFSVDVLSRLSKAGIEAFTLYAARAIFSNVKIGPNGEIRLYRALDKLSAFPSFGKVLWFGFGVKHIIWSMQESTEGLNCLGICACLTEGYSTFVAAKIIRELFLLYNPPAELTPALRQWVALVESSGGLLASSEFGLVLHGLTKLCLRDGGRNLRCNGSPKDIALVLKEVFEVSAGRLNRVFVSGGPDCAWIAAVAHWLLDLRVEVRDQDGTIIYRPDGTRSEPSPDAQVIVTYYQEHLSEMLRVSRKHYVIPSGKLLFGSAHGSDHCRSNVNGEGEYDIFCLPALIITMCTLVRVMSIFCMHQDLEVQPTRSGLESLYYAQELAIGNTGKSYYDPVVNGLLGSWPMQTLVLAQLLFTGHQYDRKWDKDSVVVVSHSGLCFYLNTLTEIISDPQRACVVTVVPGKVEWNGFMYSRVRDQATSEAMNIPETGYNAASMTTVTKYDDLAASSTPGLNAELIIEEMFPESTSLSAIYRVTNAAFPGRHFSLGAAEIWERLNFAFTAASCEGKTCDPLNGFQSILAEGEGFLFSTPDWLTTRLPITRVLSAKDVSVWVALSQDYLLTSDDGMKHDIGIGIQGTGMLL
ncbi:hypothetical protein FGADI_720 [Fusarium gaditjirri]|uniref:Uncharacterized protein n=1 Tax=Fusarium gaditjirri TaxID=282569 RepID=A0A8H4TN23_9HYPO|nr:hypothetical protein FGADI_720 [Fusarium gaditjirri]